MPENRIGQPWTDDEDRKLIAWGSWGPEAHAFVARHDLGRTEEEGRERIAWLRANKPGLVSQIEASVDR